METDTQEPEVLKNIRIERAAKDKILEVKAAIKDKIGTSATFAESITLACNFYLDHLSTLPSKAA